ncbi:DEAD/DEAH box helicase [Fodinisporobacter ferrooxydans]|uniref:DEAD/DEAH box helicase n=1 Tax=Fodinisporobacter ferrooxydans TaxID=2901836 RepID=A0ABY4CQD0_9BACL|nr:DEAD/DEAH box helicase [Alicyclobacillaceae bacterium MYW30-H2]
MSQLQMQTVQLEVNAVWQPSGRFFLYAKNRHSNYIPADQLAPLLFTWDPYSYYGTMHESAAHNGIPCIILSPRHALEYFSNPTARNHHVSVMEHENLRALRSAAKIIKHALQQGNFAPDFEIWKTADTLQWKLLFPDKEVHQNPSFMETRELQPGDNDQSVWSHLNIALFYVNDWLQAIFRELLEQNNPVHDAWQQVLETYPALAAHTDKHLWLDEEDWLIAIGWQQNTTPFHTVLQLDEPVDDEETWLLHIMLQDNENPDTLIPYSQKRPLSDQPLPDSFLPFEGRIRKDMEIWMQLVPWLKDPNEDGRLLAAMTTEQAYNFLTNASERLIGHGYTILLPGWWKELKKQKPKVKMNIRSSAGAKGQSIFGLQQIMDFDWKLALGNIELSEKEFGKWLDEKHRLIKFQGQWIPLDAQLQKQVRNFMKQLSKKNGLTFRDVLEMHLIQGTADLTDASPIDDSQEPPIDDHNPEAAGLFPELSVELELNQHILALFEQLKHIRGIPQLPAALSFQGTLRKYQTEGVSWLLFLRSLGLGACLADDMGLGKTIQWINYLLHVKDKQKQSTPTLLVCPTSVLGNWQKEIDRFAPSLTIYLHHGTNRKKGEDFLQTAQTVDVVLTSYTLTHLDEEEFRTVHWNAICLDEAQNIKNVYTKQSAAIRRLEADHRVAMTGTPMENRLTELWSIMDFVNPGYLGSLSSFQKQFVQPIEKSNDPTRIEQVKRLIQPFLLRRVKTSPDIELDLPEKQESKLYVSLTVEQAAMYESIIQDMFERLDVVSAMERRGLILSTLTKIKQLCNHPALVLKESGQITRKNRSNKMERLLDMVQELRQEGDSCLIFTQFVEMGHLLVQFLEQELQEQILFLHGGVSKTKRDRMIAQFQDQMLPLEERRHIFLLSLKAGGVGLNLTAASHVFHFDRWWNPAVENQATDRAFRIGQTQHVQVHKFVTLGTLEERIDELIDKKQGMNDQIVGGGENWITELSTDDLRNLFVLRKDWIQSDEG